jgi:hypothetical protein
MPELPADAWNAVNELVDTWIGEEEHTAYLDQYDIYRAHEKAAERDGAAGLRAKEAWERLQSTAREHSAFFQAAIAFRNLVASLRERPGKG